MKTKGVKYYQLQLFLRESALIAGKIWIMCYINLVQKWSRHDITFSSKPYIVTATSFN